MFWIGFARIAKHLVDQANRGDDHNINSADDSNNGDAFPPSLKILQF
jgi:hypothetical protein